MIEYFIKYIIQNKQQIIAKNSIKKELIPIQTLSVRFHTGNQYLFYFLDNKIHNIWNLFFHFLQGNIMKMAFSWYIGTIGSLFTSWPFTTEKISQTFMKYKSCRWIWSIAGLCYIFKLPIVPIYQLCMDRFDCIYLPQFKHCQSGFIQETSIYFIFLIIKFVTSEICFSIYCLNFLFIILIFTSWPFTTEKISQTFMKYQSCRWIWSIAGLCYIFKLPIVNRSWLSAIK
jgi:hypothetical protein